MKKVIEIISPYLFKIVVLNLVSFIAILIWLGGDALNGKIVLDQFYLGTQTAFVEVSELTYNYSKYHAISVVVILLFAATVRFISYKLNMTNNSCPFR